MQRRHSAQARSGGIDSTIDYKYILRSCTALKITPEDTKDSDVHLRWQRHGRMQAVHCIQHMLFCGDEVGDLRYLSMIPVRNTDPFEDGPRVAASQDSDFRPLLLV